MSISSALVLMDHRRISRSIHRMAYEIAEQNAGHLPTDLFGIDQSGYAVAGILTQVLESLIENEVRLHQLPIKNGDFNKVFHEINTGALKNHFILVVDDVIFSGRTMFKALRIISERIDIVEIHTAVLVDRGHRQFPIKAEFAGMKLPTKLDEHVSVVVGNNELQRVVLQKM